VDDRAANRTVVSGGETLAALEAGDSSRSTIVLVHAAKSIPGSRPARADVDDPEQMRLLADRVLGADGVPDVLVNNAGIGIAGAFMDTGVDVWRRIVDLNLLGVVEGCRLFGRAAAGLSGAGGCVARDAVGLSRSPPSASERHTMLLKHRPPRIKSEPVELRAGLEHLDQNSIAVLRWLNANKLDYVVIGALARAIRGDVRARGHVAIVPAPYDRNYERLCAALVAARAGLRAELGAPGVARPSAIPVKLTTDKLARGRRWLLRFGDYDLDIEGDGSHEHTAGEGRPTPRYQELLYEAGRFELTEGLSVEVASPEDIEHYSHLRRTGAAPEFRVTRNSQPEHETA
jgi:NAD(P)-dependent dehydrogenase (short-subunit alcohol dehydrogenase family)